MPLTQRGTKRARTDGADGGGTSGEYDKDVKLSEGLAASLGKGKYAKQSEGTDSDGADAGVAAGDDIAMLRACMRKRRRKDAPEISAGQEPESI